MSATGVQVRFAAEFALFLVSLAGVTFSLLRSDLLVTRPWARAASSLGFASLGAAALVAGGLIVDDPTAAPVVTLRLVGIGLLVIASLGWQSDRGGRELLRIGLVALILAEALRGDQTTVTDVARGVGAISIGACFLGASARVISVRIASSAAMVIFASLTAIAVAVSAVVTHNVETEALARYRGRVGAESSAVNDAGKQWIESAKVMAAALGTTTDRATASALLRATDTARDPQAEQADRNLVRTRIEQLLSAFVADVDLNRGPTLLVDRIGRPVVVTPPETDQSLLLGLANDPIVTSALSSGGVGQTQGIVEVEKRALSVATAPLNVDGVIRGVVVRTSQLNSDYLRGLGSSVAAEEAGVTLALADRDGVLEDQGTRVARSAVEDLAKEALRDAVRISRRVGDRFLAAAPVENKAGPPQLAVVLSAPRTQEEANRKDLYRILFLVAMGAGAGALLLAALAGERIGAGLRRLAGTAEAVQGGNLDARAAVTTDDELGQLGRSFNAMAASLGDLTDDLRTAAVDEAELRARLEAVVGGMGEALVAVDADGVITDFNASAEELFDLPASRARDRLVTDVLRLRSEDGTNLARRLRRPVVEGWSDNGTITLADGREIPVAISAGALRGPGNEVRGAVFVLRDERREAELERMKTEFLANISHELRTPLTPIKGFASILQTRDLPPAKTKGFADEISVAADQLERIIGQLVNFSTIVGGRLSIDPKPVAVRGLVDRTLKPWRERVDGSHKLVRRVPAGLPDVVVDGTYVGQALDELLDNAVKYSPDGGRIVVSADVVEGEDGPEVEISVSDEGVGIPPERLDAVLQDFTQADASSTRRFGGLGLGLALVQRVARAHGGDLRIADSSEDGTTVTLVLPVDGPDGGRSR
jgi:PAS domain S-box-containing protein